VVLTVVDDPPDEVVVVVEELLERLVLVLLLLLELELDLELPPLPEGRELPPIGNPPILDALPPIFIVLNYSSLLTVLIAGALPLGPPTVGRPPILDALPPTFMVFIYSSLLLLVVLKLDVLELDLELPPLLIGLEPAIGNPPIFDALPPIFMVLNYYSLLIDFIAMGLIPGPPTVGSLSESSSV